MPAGIVRVSRALRFMPPRPCATALFILFAVLACAADLCVAQVAPTGSSASANWEGPLPLESAIAKGLRFNLDLAAAADEVAATEAAVDQAATRLNPEVALLVEDSKKETRTTTVQLNQVLELGGKRQAGINAAERTRDTAMLDQNAKHAEIRAAVISTFFDVLIAQEKLTLAQSSFEIAQRGTTVAARRVAAGKVDSASTTPVPGCGNTRGNAMADCMSSP